MMQSATVVIPALHRDHRAAARSAEGGPGKPRMTVAVQRGRHTMNELVASYGLIAPEIVLVVGAMALLMLGVFRPENDREAETIGWLAIVRAGAGGVARPRAAGRPADAVRRRLRGRRLRAAS